MSPSHKPPHKYKLIADENLRREVIEFLRKQGYGIKVPAKGLKNGQVLSLALEEKRVLLTHDKDFLDPLLYPPTKTDGIVVIRIHPPTVSEICAALEDLFNKLSPEHLNKKLIVLEKDGFRIR